MNDTTGNRTPDVRSSGLASRARSNDVSSGAASEMPEPTPDLSPPFRGEAIGTNLSDIDFRPLTVFTDDGAEDTDVDTSRRATLATHQRAQTAGGVDIGESWPGLEPVVFGANPAHTAAV